MRWCGIGRIFFDGRAHGVERTIRRVRFRSDGKVERDLCQRLVGGLAGALVVGARIEASSHGAGGVADVDDAFEHRHELAHHGDAAALLRGELDGLRAVAEVLPGQQRDGDQEDRGEDQGLALEADASEQAHAGRPDAVVAEELAQARVVALRCVVRSGRLA